MGLIEKSELAADYINNYRDFVNNNYGDIIIPYGTTHIREKLFYKDSNFDGCYMPDSITSVGKAVFSETGIRGMVLSDNLSSLSEELFYHCSHLQGINYNKYAPNNISIGINCFNNTEFSFFQDNNGDCTNKIVNIGANAFYNCHDLTSFVISSNLESCTNTSFSLCTNLQYITIENGFNCNNLNLSASTKYSVATIVSWLNALANRTGQFAYTLTIGAINLAKLSAEQIAIATNKNWNLA